MDSDKAKVIKTDLQARVYPKFVKKQLGYGHFPTRDWVIPFLTPKTPWYTILGAAVPALLLTILLFMDQQITSVIVNRKEHKLKVHIYVCF